MNTFEKLAEHFERFPGIGARQARRFAYHLLTQNEARLTELSALIGGIKSSVATCSRCRRFFTLRHKSKRCTVCEDTSRDASKLLIIANDSDIAAIERSSSYDGYYFVLGGTVPLLESEEIKRLHGGALKARIKEGTSDGTLKEVILGFAVNPDGENTGRYVRSLISEAACHDNLIISTLGRGLSTGSELEYADPDTVKNALHNRH